MLGVQMATVREIVDILRRNYCGHVGLEYMHINDVEERRFLQERMEGRDKEIHFTVAGKRAILNKVIEAEKYEKFLGRNYVDRKSVVEGKSVEVRVDHGRHRILNKK